MHYNVNMNIEIIKSRRKSISIEISRDLKIIVRAPFFTTKKQINRFIEEKSDWINKHLEIVKNRVESESNIPKFTDDEIKALTKQAKAIIPQRAEYFAKIMGVKFNRISIKLQVSRWGSCSAKGNLNFNCLLMLCPQEVQDYVIIHELCHLKELNHSQKFWNEVAKYCPDYKAHKQWLKVNGTMLINRLK